MTDPQSPLADLAYSIAHKLAYELLRTGTGRLQEAAFGSEEEQALERAFDRAFVALLLAMDPNLDEETAQKLVSPLRDFVHDPETAGHLLDIALERRPADLSLLRSRMVAQDFEPEDLPLPFEAAMGQFLAALEEALYDEAAGRDSPLYNRYSLSQIAALRRDVRDMQPAPATPEQAPLHPAHLDAYLKVVRTQCGWLETRPYRHLSELRGAPPRFSLLGEEGRAGVYVPLRFDLHASRSELRGRMGGNERALEELERDLSRTDLELREVLATPGHVVIIGAAGSGKTTVLHLVAAVLAEVDPALAREALSLEAQADGFPVPVYLALRDFEHACQTDAETYKHDVDSPLRFADDHYQRWHPGTVPEGFVGDIVRSGRAWLLLDALDEVADFGRRIEVRQVIEGLAGAFPGNRLLVTARVAAYASVEARLNDRFHVATVRDLVREQWAPLVERLYAGLEADGGVAAERARLLLDRLDDSVLLQEMAKTPLMVWTATLIHYADRELPEQRAELYRAYVEVLLGARLQEEESAEAAKALREERWPMEDRRLYLAYGAYRVHEGAEAESAGGQDQGGLVVVDERDLVRGILAPFLGDYLGLKPRQARREAEAFLAVMVERSGLLYAHEEGYSFGDHLTVQEFLAANYLVENLRGTGEWSAFLQARAGQSWWREVFLLTAGYLLQSPQQARRYLLDELGRLPGGGDAAAYGLAWAGRALLEIPARRVGWHGNARDELARRLVGVLWQNPPATSAAARVEAGDVLGRLGDPRFTGPTLLPEFMAIPGGRFWMGSDEEEEAARKNEMPRHEVDLDAYALARYPATHAMYRCFVEAGGYADERWWGEAKSSGYWSESEGFSRGNQPRYWDDERFNGPNQPVVGVTWYEAAAYCRWLTAVQNDGQRYRLPTEAEWERAARGPEGHRYPWGDGWEAGRANAKELNLDRSTPVGVFADGASAEGVLDLAGNVWEWCGDWYAGETYRQRCEEVARNPQGPDSGQSKVLRGGAWYSERNRVRCAFRIINLPDYWYNYNGCRVARGPLR